MVLLGRPGSGKSTLSTYLALSLAEAALGDTTALQRLGKRWKHGPLLPLPVTLREFAATLPADLDRGPRQTSLGFHCRPISPTADAGRASGRLCVKWRKPGARCSCWTAVDEAGDETRRARVLEAVDDFTRHAGAKCRFLLTSRPYAWDDATAPVPEAASKEQTPQLHTLPPAYRLADFEPDQIREFIQHVVSRHRRIGLDRDG